MSKTAILFALAFVATCGLSLYMPLFGTLGYIAHYSIGPEQQWWAGDLRPFGIRYSFVLAIFTGIGMLLNLGKLSYGQKFLQGQEKLILLFLGLVWLSVMIGDPTRETQTAVDHPSVKLTKVVVFVLMLTHIVTRLRHVDMLFWVLAIGGLILGMQARNVSPSAFVQGRLETVGGPDFRDSNTLAIYLASILPIIGVQFLRGRWLARIISLAAGAFAVNAIVLTRSRGAVVGIAAGAVLALMFAPRRHRGKVILGLIVAAAGLLYLADVGFMKRTGTIGQSEEERDVSAQSRVEIWKGGLAMIADHPLGVGAGNFPQTIGRYASAHRDRDAHNTYIRCAAELGIQGLLLLAALIFNALRVSRDVIRRADDLPGASRDHVALLSYGAMVSLTIFLVGGMFGSLVFIEALWWLIALPVCLNRAVENLHEDEPVAAVDEANAPDKPVRKTRKRVRRRRKADDVPYPTT